MRSKSIKTAALVLPAVLSLFTTAIAEDIKITSNLDVSLLRNTKLQMNGIQAKGTRKIEKDHAADTWTQEKSTKKKEVKLHSKSNLYDVKGIGPITVAELHKRGVKTREHLLNIVQKTSFEEWCKQYSFVHQHKKFWKSWKNYDNNSAFV